MFFLLRYILYFLSTYILTTALLFTMHLSLPHPPRIIGFIARSMSSYLALIICAAYGTIASGLLKIFDLHYKYAQWTTAKSFKLIGTASTGVKFEIVDNGRAILDDTRPAVFLVNHQTELDVLLLAYIWPLHCSVTAKKSLRNIPFLGWYMSLSGTIFIDRVNTSAARKAFEGAAKTINQRKQSVLIFPEGTRSYSAEPMLLPFKKGAFHLAVQAGVPVVPVVAENYSRVLNVKARRFEAGTIRVKGE
jgi:lysophosphatidate acyltransferase